MVKVTKKHVLLDQNVFSQISMDLYSANDISCFYPEADSVAQIIVSNASLYFVNVFGKEETDFSDLAKDPFSAVKLVSRNGGSYTSLFEPKKYCRHVMQIDLTCITRDKLIEITADILGGQYARIIWQKQEPTHPHKVMIDFPDEETLTLFRLKL